MQHADARRAVSSLVVAGLAVVGLAGCGPADAPRAAAAAPTRTTPSASPTPAPAPTWALTGRTGDVVARPALAVKIENSVDARPQTGLDATDLVYEEVVEGGITRFVAVFQSQLPPEIGPVRSVRPMDPAIAAPLHGLLAFSGGYQGYISRAQKAGVQPVSNDAGAAGFHRISARKAPHNVYADPAKLVADADPAHRAAPPALFGFATGTAQPTAVATGTPAGALHLTLSPLSHPTWTWDAGGNRWLRAEGSSPAVTAGGQQLAAANVVVVRVDVVQTGRKDAAGNHVPETVLTGTGQAVVASGGHTVAATWAKGGDADPLALTAADGSPVRLAAGNTWIELVPNGTGNVATG